MPGGEILVVGSINLDMLLFQERLPARGETIHASEVREEFGGKGANQAVQAARLGQRVIFLGAVGDDPRGEACVQNLRDHGIDCHISTVDGPTGLGVVHVVGPGDVYATVLAGANAAVDVDLVRRHRDLFQRASWVLLQNEIPADAVVEAVEQAATFGARVIFNAAPARAVPASVTRRCDYLVLNEEEAMFFLGRRFDSRQEIKNAVHELREYCSKVVVTLGEEGSIIYCDSQVHSIPAVPVDAVDTTGAGDSYVGAFAAGLNEGRADLEAASIAAAVAAVTTTGAGAQTSMPRGEDVEHEAVRAQTPDHGVASQLRRGLH